MMQISSLLFLLYVLPVTVAVYQLLRVSTLGQNLWLVLTSLALCSWGNPKSALVLLAIIACNYGLGLWVDKARSSALAQRWIFAAMLAVNLGPLLFYHYLPSLIELAEGISGSSYPFRPQAPPLGIAFIALQGISYVVDIHRQKVRAKQDPVDCALYLCFFPVLFAGPILRFQDVAAQIYCRDTSWSMLSAGFCRFFVGLGKYVVLALPLSALADIAFHTSNITGIFATTPASMALLGLLAFVLQLYYRLSGFSDMAIGLGQMFGFVYPENFNYPVLSTSVTDFWKRSYRSLTVWFEEYVYLPLCRRSKNLDRQLLYRLIMWLLIGLWIGPGVANLIFVFFTFVFLLIEMIVEFEHSSLAKGWRRLWVITIMSISLIALRVNTVYEFALFIGNLFGANGNGFGGAAGLTLLGEFWPVLALGILFLFPILPRWERAMASKTRAAGILAKALYPVGMLALVLVIFSFLIRNGRDTSILPDYTIWSMFHE